MNSLPIPINNSRVGFHYFQDFQHYREIDLTTWLPNIQELDASWMIINAPQDRAIPEPFITALLNNNIEPVIHFDLSLSAPPPLEDLSLLLHTYKNWGVHYVIIFNRPNIKSSWISSSWAQHDLVERFLDRFIPIASAVVREELIPVFPPLEPGGDYWDTAFLKSTLESLKRRGKTDIIDNLVLTASAAFSPNGLNWGAGGPERWPGARPYFTSDTEQDQRGFYIFEWYNAISHSILQRTIPTILVNVGKNSEPSVNNSNFSTIFQLLNKEEVINPGSVENKLNSIPENIISCCFQLVPNSIDPDSNNNYFFNSDKESTEIHRSVMQWILSRKNGQKTRNEPLRENSHPLQHYLLLPAYEWGISEWHLDVIKPFVKNHLPTIGFSLSEAALASKVTVVGGIQSFSEESLQFLRDSGSTVERISGDGTSIASQLAER